MSYNIARGDTIALAWMVKSGDPAAVTSVTGAIRPALSGNPQVVDSTKAKVADLTVALQAAASDGSYPAYWLATLTATLSLANIPAGDYLADLRFAFSDGSILNSDLLSLRIYEPATL